MYRLVKEDQERLKAAKQASETNHKLELKTSSLLQPLPLHIKKSSPPTIESGLDKNKIEADFIGFG